MTKDIHDIVAAFETRHARAVNVAPAMALAVTQAAWIIASLEDTHPQYKQVRENLLDGIQDVAELIDGFTGDVADVCRYHREVIEVLQIGK